MSEDEINNFDDEFFKIRSKIASENMEWVKLFKERNSYLILMIFSAILVNSFLIIYGLILHFPFILLFYLIIPNLAWVVICFPYFYFNINKLTKLIEMKREEAVLTFFKTKNSIKDISLSTGIRMDFVEYYLQKNNLQIESKNKQNG